MCDGPHGLHRGSKWVCWGGLEGPNSCAIRDSGCILVLEWLPGAKKGPLLVTLGCVLGVFGRVLCVICYTTSNALFEILVHSIRICDCGLLVILLTILLFALFYRVHSYSVDAVEVTPPGEAGDHRSLKLRSTFRLGFYIQRTCGIIYRCHTEQSTSVPRSISTEQRTSVLRSIPSPASYCIVFITKRICSDTLSLCSGTQSITGWTDSPHAGR